jgi:hypothetical protein
VNGGDVSVGELGHGGAHPVAQSFALDAGSSGAPLWSLFLTAGIALIVGLFGPWLLRKTGRGQVQAASRANMLTAEAIANAVDSRIEARLGALELDKWRRREETMRLLRWAAEQATKSGNDQEDAWRVGLATLEALGRSELLQEEDQVLIDAVLQALYAEPEDEYAEAEAEGREPDVVLDDGVE